MPGLQKLCAVALAALMVAALGVAGTRQPAQALADGLASVPPMGWNGYNHFSRAVTAAIVEGQARALVSSGMKADGYEYVNLDGGWDLLHRNAAGQLQPDPSKFPQGIRPVADYVHSLGLKFGIYASAGLTNCADTSAGSYGHYQQDARMFASWGVDYLKFDWCNIPYQNYPGMTAEQVAKMLATQMGSALTAAGRPVVYDINDASGARDHDQDWTWAAGVASLWRVTSDISDSYTSMVSHFCGCNLPPGQSSDVYLSRYAGPGGWNDPDMLEVGNGGMTTTEDRSEFSLWAELAAPLIAGNDLTAMPAATRVILTNRQVIAVDQDPLGSQGYPVDSAAGRWVLTKPLANGDRAVVLFNAGNAPQAISTTAQQAGFTAPPPGAHQQYLLTNLWTGAGSQTTGTIAATVPAHGVVMYRIHSVSQ